MQKILPVFKNAVNLIVNRLQMSPGRKRISLKFDAVNALIDRILNYEGCDSKTLMLRRHNWIMSLSTLIPVCFLTIGFIIFTPQLTLLITYGFILIALFLIYLIPGNGLNPVHKK